MKPLNLTLGLLGLVAVLAACSGGSGTPSPASPAASGGPAGDAVTIVAKDLKFDPTEVEVPADAPFDLVLDNQDGAPHNVAVYTDSSASTKISVGEVFSGPAQKTQSVPALAAGTYFFRCDVHPDMQGSILAG